MNLIGRIIFWSVIAAAFIGPGTVTTAAKAGADYGPDLLWALGFSVLACFILQEAASRVTSVSGTGLGDHFNRLLNRRSAVFFIILTIVLGCVAYEAGNLLGAVAGLALLTDLPSYALTGSIGLAALLLLSIRNIGKLVQWLGIIVAVMGICFVSSAVLQDVSFSSVLSGLFVPRIPDGGNLLVIALIGTTVVPYNIFLGAGMKHSQRLKEMRISLGLAILLGGIISMGILITGTAIQEEFTFTALSLALENQLGPAAGSLLGIGLFAAGLSSSVTAPLAAAISMKALFPRQAQWNEGGRYFRLTAVITLLTGLAFGLSGIQPVPVIVAAQAFNGIILPLVAVLLFILSNSREQLGEHCNTVLQNVLMGVVTAISVLLGLSNVISALGKVIPSLAVSEQTLFAFSLVGVIALAYPVFRAVTRLRRRK
jgi:manganese transport protein